MDLETFLAIMAMAVATAATRLAGPSLARRLPRTGPVTAAIEAAPGAILIAIVAPIIVAAGPAGAVAAAVTVLVARNAPTLVAIVCGTATVALLRAAL